MSSGDVCFHLEGEYLEARSLRSMFFSKSSEYAELQMSCEYAALVAYGQAPASATNSARKRPRIIRRQGRWRKGCRNKQLPLEPVDACAGCSGKCPSHQAATTSSAVGACHEATRTEPTRNKPPAAHATHFTMRRDGFGSGATKQFHCGSFHSRKGGGGWEVILRSRSHEWKSLVTVYLPPNVKR